MSKYLDLSIEKIHNLLLEKKIKPLDLVLEVAPNLFAKAGAKCAFGKCPEGKMSCGEKQQPREKQKVKIYER